MNILGIETSCDETAAAVVADGSELLSSVVASQIDIHAEFGGVVPEVAARSHVEVMLPIVDKALREAGCGWDQIDAIAATAGPGLIGSLLIGDLTAQTLAELKGKPLVPVNHVEAHLYAAFLYGHSPTFPLLGLVVSGGHTQLVLLRDHGDYEVLGRTRDDAAGEAFDKVAKIIGLPYPGGPAISAAAAHGDSSVFSFPKPKLGTDSLDFSFSGLKTAVLRAAQAAVGRDYRTPSTELPSLLSDQQRNDIAAGFQQTAVSVLSERLVAAAERHSPVMVVVAGGVAANQALRQAIDSQLPNVIYPPMRLCTDNAAMIASLGFYAYRRGQTVAPSELLPNPILSM